jgi:hypothetical protein
VGCSPDRLVGDEGLLEIKAPLPQTQIEYWLSGEINERFRPQLQGQLYVSQRSWVGIVCWHDVLPKIVTRVEPDEKFIKALDRELQMFNFFIERVMEKIRATYEVPVLQRSLALKAAFRASREIRPQRRHPNVGRISEREWSMVKRSANRRSRTRLATLHQNIPRKPPVSPSSWLKGELTGATALTIL